MGRLERLRRRHEPDESKKLREPPHIRGFFTLKELVGEEYDREEYVGFDVYVKMTRMAFVGTFFNGLLILKGKEKVPSQVFFNLPGADPSWGVVPMRGSTWAYQYRLGPTGTMTKKEGLGAALSIGRYIGKAFMVSIPHIGKLVQADPGPEKFAILQDIQDALRENMIVPPPVLAQR